MDKTTPTTITTNPPRDSKLDSESSFLFEDLNESAQQKVLDDNRYRDTNYDGWWEGVYEQNEEEMKAIGFDVSNRFFSGFSSQGDGAVILGVISFYDFFKQSPEGIALVASIKLLHSGDEELYDGAIRFTQSGHYTHEKSYAYSMEVNYENWHVEVKDKVAEGVQAFVEGNIDDWMVKRNKSFYKALEAEYDYLTSDECLREHYEYDDDLYTEDGEPL